MRLTIIGPAYPLRGGVAHHVYWLHRELTARGHEVQVISYRSLYPKLFFPGTTIFDTSELKLDPGARAMLTPLNPVTWIQSVRAAKEFKPDAVLIEWWNTFFALLVGTIARMLAWAGLKSVVECHNVLPHERRSIDRPLLKFAFSPVDRFITHSQSDREHLLDILPGKNVEVAPLPVLREFSPAKCPDRSGRTILFFGIVRKYKGLEVLLRAMPLVLSKVECNLIVAGEFYDPVEGYLQLIGELGIGSHVRIENRYVPNEGVLSLFDQADVLVLPYVSATQSGVARIATANRLPIIASQTGGLSEVVEDNVTGFLFPPGDVDALANRLIHYFVNGDAKNFIASLSLLYPDNDDAKLASTIEEVTRGIRVTELAAAKIER